MSLVSNIKTIATKMRESTTPRVMKELKSSLEEAINSKLMIDGLGETNKIVKSTDDKEAVESLISIYKEFTKNVDNEAERLASLQKISMYSQLQGAAKTQKRLDDIVDASGKGVERANMGEVNNKFAQAFHNDGASIRQAGSDAYDVARTKVQGLDMVGEEAESFI